MTNRLHRTSRYRRLIRPLVFATFGTTCHLCGHDGATDADLLTPHRDAPAQAITHRSFRPAHGVGGCPTCGRKCNQERGAQSTDAVWRPQVEW